MDNAIIFHSNHFHILILHLSSLIPPPVSITMSTPAEYYRSLPPVSKTFGVACFMTTAAYYFRLYEPQNISLSYELVFKRFQIWRLITNFFFLGPFSLPFAFRLLIIARYGVSLERGPFDKRTADYVWMLVFGALSLLAMAAVPILWSPFMGVSLVFMIVYVWGRELPNARINFYGVVSLKGFYLPWSMLALDLLLGNPLKPDILGIVAGHIYYFLTVLYPLAGGKYIFKTPLLVHKLVAYWGEGIQVNSPVQRDPSAGTAFRGRSFRLNGDRSRSSTTAQDQTNSPAQQQPNPAAGNAFSGRSYRLSSNTLTNWLHTGGEGIQVNALVQRDPSAGSAFRGRSFRLNGDQPRSSIPAQDQTNSFVQQQPNPAAGSAFRGRSYCLSSNTR